MADDVHGLDIRAARESGGDLIETIRAAVEHDDLGACRRGAGEHGGITHRAVDEDDRRTASARGLDGADLGQAICQVRGRGVRGGLGVMVGGDISHVCRRGCFRLHDRRRDRTIEGQPLLQNAVRRRAVQNFEFFHRGILSCIAGGPLAALRHGLLLGLEISIRAGYIRIFYHR